MELANVLPSMKVWVILMIHLSPICISHACKLYHGYHQRVSELRAAEFTFSTKLTTFCWDLCSRQDLASRTPRLHATYISPGVLVAVTFLCLFTFVSGLICRLNRSSSLCPPGEKTILVFLSSYRLTLPSFIPLLFTLIFKNLPYVSNSRTVPPALSPKSPCSIFIHSFISALKWPQCKPYQMQLHKPPQHFPKRFFFLCLCVFVCACEQSTFVSISPTTIPTCQSRCSNNIHKYLTPDISRVAGWKGMTFLQCRMGISGNPFNLKC